MGCLKKIIGLIILVLAFIGFKSIGGWDFIKDKIPSLFEKPSQEALLEKSKDVADFTDISEEYEIDKTANILGFKAVLAEHKASGQKLVVLNPGKKELITKKDFDGESLSKKLSELNEKFAYQFIRLENLEITKKGNFSTMGQTVPYARFEADVVNLPISKIQGMIAVAEFKDGKEQKNKILLAANDSDKYSQIITEQFFNRVK